MNSIRNYFVAIGIFVAAMFIANLATANSIEVPANSTLADVVQSLEDEIVIGPNDIEAAGKRVEAQIGPKPLEVQFAVVSKADVEDGDGMVIIMFFDAEGEDLYGPVFADEAVVKAFITDPEV